MAHSMFISAEICPPLNSTNVYISCNYRGEEVSCSEPILPGTQATLTCKPFYRFSVTTLSNSWMKCLDSGIWDINMFDCVPGENDLFIFHSSDMRREQKCLYKLSEFR
ncbi:hypothetical protein EAI_02724 [Harpegnathos saltator]|uniref:Sushi domain-containing protein n=1 Tax=Harpegnathos saltator TaxID=610380 RepID=E2BMQ4_HARSA|nr:hypothetical protein EAI_02724 [Harpegnathos saltator]